MGQRLKCQAIFLVNEYSRLPKPEDAVLICIQNGLKKKLHFSTSGERSGFQGDEVWALVSSLAAFFQQIEVKKGRCNTQPSHQPALHLNVHLIQCKVQLNTHHRLSDNIQND